MAKDLFSGSLAKVDRANTFIAELDSELAKFRDANKFSGKIAVVDGEYAINVEFPDIGDLPSVITGDVIHNLRASLDLLASELVRLQGHSDAKVYFPFAKDVDAFDKAIKDRDFDKAGADAVDLLRTFEPYKGGNDLLRALHDLDIQDKHTNLVSIGTNGNMQVSASYDINNPLDGTVSIDIKSIEYCFAKNTVFEKQPASVILIEMERLVRNIIESFAEMVKKRNPAE